MSANPLSVQRDLADAYLRYIDTAYWLRDARLMSERRDVLVRNGSLYSESFLEPVLPYDATVDLLETTRAAGLHDNTAEAVGHALFGTFTPPDQPIRLRDHQAESVMHHFRSGVADGRNVVVTSGTGSGKTERLLLPVLLRMIEESRAWSP